MTIALLLAFLTGHSFQTECVQTQDNGRSGYAIDRLSFFDGGKLNADQLAVTIGRTLYADEKCEGEAKSNESKTGRVTFSRATDSAFFNNQGVEQFNADWSMNASKAQEIELGSIGVSELTQTVRIARNPPGFMRNTMLQIIPFKAAKK